jgi:hypothetical protein
MFQDFKGVYETKGKQKNLKQTLNQSTQKSNLNGEY